MSTINITKMTHIVQVLRQIQVLVHHLADLLAHIALKKHLTLPRQPPQDVESVGIDGRVAARAAAFGAWQDEGRVDDEALQTPAVAQLETDDFGEALENLVVGWDGDAKVFDLAAGALV